MNSATLFRNSALYSAYNAVWATAAIFVPLVAMIICLQCIDAVGWAAGRASGL